MRYDLANLFKEAFGIRQPVFMIPEKSVQSPVLNYSGIEALPDYYAEETSVSWMGTPIVFPATFLGGSYKIYSKNGVLTQSELADFELPPATMFSFRRAKNITRTEVLGGNGTVKEIYGFDDWVIDVRGVALDEPTRSAHDQIAELLLWERLADAISISGKLFAQRKIDRVVMTDWNDNLTQGGPGAVPFQFQLISDEAIELNL